MNKEQRLFEAFAAYEAGESLATLQNVFADVAVELNQLVEAERLLKEGKAAMQPSPALARKIVAAVARQEQSKPSLFLSSLWQLAAPVGVAALAVMFILSTSVREEASVGISEQADLRTVPMMAKNAQFDTMAIQAPEGEADQAFESAAADDSEDQSLYFWQMAALGLLATLSFIVLLKHLQARRQK